MSQMIFPPLIKFCNVFFFQLKDLKVMDVVVSLSSSQTFQFKMSYQIKTNLLYLNVTIHIRHKKELY